MYATDLGHWFEVRSTSKFACFFFSYSTLNFNQLIINDTIKFDSEGFVAQKIYSYYMQQQEITGTFKKQEEIQFNK